MGDVVRSWYTLVELPAAAALSGVIWDKFRCGTVAVSQCSFDAGQTAKRRDALRLGR